MGAVVSAVWGWDPEVQRRFHEDWFVPDRIQIIVADGTDIGVLSVERRPDSLYLSRIELLPAFQRKKIGSALVRQLAREAQSAALPLVLDVLAANDAAIRLYRRLGFREVARSEGTAERLRMQLE